MKQFEVDYDIKTIFEKTERKKHPLWIKRRKVRIVLLLMPILITIITYLLLNFEADIKDDILMRANLAIFENIFISKEILKMIEERSPVEIGVVNVPAYDE